MQFRGYARGQTDSQTRSSQYFASPTGAEVIAIRIAHEGGRRRKRGLCLRDCHHVRVAVEKKFNVDWSSERIHASSHCTITTKRKLYATLLLFNFQVHRHIEMIPVATYVSSARRPARGIWNVTVPSHGHGRPTCTVSLGIKHDTCTWLANTEWAKFTDTASHFYPSDAMPARY